MRIIAPRPSDFINQDFSSFPLGALVFIPTSVAPYAVPAVKISVLLGGTQEGVFLLDAYAGGVAPLPKGAFLSPTSYPQAFRNPVAGLASAPVLELAGLTKTAQPWVRHGNPGELALTSNGPLIASTGGGGARALLNPQTWVLDASAQARSGVTSLVWTTWQMVWTTPSGAEAVITF
jgi:hypothetical protein